MKNNLVFQCILCVIILFLWLMYRSCSKTHKKIDKVLKKVKKEGYCKNREYFIEKVAVNNKAQIDYPVDVKDRLTVNMSSSGAKKGLCIKIGAELPRCINGSQLGTLLNNIGDLGKIRGNETKANAAKTAADAAKVIADTNKTTLGTATSSQITSAIAAKAIADVNKTTLGSATNSQIGSAIAAKPIADTNKTILGTLTNSQLTRAVNQTATNRGTFEIVRDTT